MIRAVGPAAVLVAASLLSGFGSACAADPDPAAVKKAKTLLEAEEKRIWRLTHVTVRAYSKCEWGPATAAGDGFKLTATYKWAGKEKGKEAVDHTTVLAFRFNAAGGFAGVPVDDVVEVVSDSSKVKPFDGATVLVVPLRAYMKKKLPDLPKTVREVIEGEIDEKVSGEQALELWLVFREHAAPPGEKDDK